MDRKGHEVQVTTYHSGHAVVVMDTNHIGVEARNYGQSQQLRFVDGYALAPIGYVKHKNPMLKRRIINSYTPEGREAIHKALGKNINIGIMHYLMRNPVPYRSAAYNDNRISLYCAQFGKCAITGELLAIGDIHCHHKRMRIYSDR